jgi:hypothetical protein
MTAGWEAELAGAFAAVPARRNPHAEAAARHLDRWVAEHGLVFRPAARERFDRARFAGFAAQTYPTADEPGLALIADWFAWLFLLDDHLDDSPLGKDPGRAAGLLTAITDVLAGTGTPPRAAAIVNALSDLWHRTAPLAEPAWRNRFVEHVLAGGMAAAWEAANRAHGRIPDEESYVENRRHTGAIYVCMDLIEIVERVHVPPPVYGGEPFARALRAACDVVCWTNDLYSLGKETALGEYHNLVPVLQHARGIGREEAIRLAAHRISVRLREFLGWEPMALAAAGAHTVAVSASLAGMRSWMRGNLDWSASTRRYRDELRGGYLEAELVDRNGGGEARRWRPNHRPG